MTTFIKCLTISKLPDSLCNLKPLTIVDTSRYGTVPIYKKNNYRTTDYVRSFIPDTIKVAIHCRASIHLSLRKGKFNLDKGTNESTINLDLNYGQIIHWRLRLSCSDSNGGKFDMFKIIVPENSENAPKVHFIIFFMCDKHDNIRNNIYYFTREYILETILIGNASLSKQIKM